VQDCTQALHRRRSADEGEQDLQRQIVMFQGTDGSDNMVLWKTNGTVADTYELTGVSPVPNEPEAGFISSQSLADPIHEHAQHHKGR
jgi:hypothetical protein